MGNCLPHTAKMPAERVFAVSVLDDKEQVQAIGHLTVTTEHMSLQNTGAESSALWELKYLRRFGFDRNVFSFEAGRRCKDGPGIWAFSTPEAEILFKMVDYYINKTTRDSSKQDERDKAATAHKDKIKLGGTVVKSDYAGVTIGGAGASELKSKSPYAQLDLSSKAKYKIPGSTASPGDKKTKTAYAELDYDKMHEVANGEGGSPNSGTVVL